MLGARHCARSNLRAEVAPSWRSLTFRPARRLLAAAGIVACCHPVLAQPSPTGDAAQKIQQQQPSGPGTVDAAAKGKELRAAIEQIYAALPMTHIPRTGERQFAPLAIGKDISQTITEYIRLGMPIDNAEAILAGAGLTVDPLRKTYSRVNEAYPFTYTTGASLVQVVDGATLRLVVQLVPEKPTDDASVKAIRAWIRKDDGK